MTKCRPPATGKGSTMIKGLIAPILSPFNDDLSFNQDMYNALAAE